VKPIRIGIVAGEASGDVLGAGLISAIQEKYPDAQFEGIGGPLMEAVGCRSFVPMERLAVMGLAEVLGRLPELLRVRRRLRRYFIENPPDLFIGVDAPDFTLALERQLKRAGITTVHYVSPQIWAWRQRRVNFIAQCADLVLTLFPFEKDFYRQHQVAVAFVGHPLADQIPLTTDQQAARKTLGLTSDSPVLGLFPGSRRSEVQRLAETFLAAATLCRQAIPDCQLVVAAANHTLQREIEALLMDTPGVAPVQVVTGQSRTVMAAADALYRKGAEQVDAWAIAYNQGD